MSIMAYVLFDSGSVMGIPLLYVPSDKLAFITILALLINFESMIITSLGELYNSFAVSIGLNNFYELCCSCIGIVSRVPPIY